MTSKIKKFLLIFIACLTLLIIAFVLWIFSLNSRVNQSLETSWFLPPLEVYANPTQFYINQRINIKQTVDELTQLNFRKRAEDKKIFANDFSLRSGDQCQMEDFSDAEYCLKFKINKNLFQINYNEENIIQSLFKNQKSTEYIEMPAQVFAQFYGDKPVLRTLTKIENYPYYCLQAVTSIEDHQFLEHEGVSITGFLRAVSGVLTGRNRGGGSTITQQLVKNYFLTSERTIKRKVTEIFMSLLLERKLSKEQILENYLNIIYMGQNGSFQVRGFASAAKHYLNKDISQLSLPQCALLAGILNNPGRFDPYRHPERSITRRNKVLNDMYKNSIIDKQELEKAIATPLPQKKARKKIATAPYFVDAVRKKLRELNISMDQGLKVYTTLKPEMQKHAQNAVAAGMKHLYQRFEKLEKLREEEKKSLQTLLISVDLETNSIQSLIGGTSFLKAPYNRAIESHRQVGSVMKPLVYLTALESLDSDGNNFHPLKIINDDKFVYKYEGQKWEPRNYSGEYWGKIPLYFALKNSINISTAKVGLSVGLEGIIDLAKRLGINSKLEPLPSLTLGAFELYPMEVAQAYSTIARFGKHTSLHLIRRVTDLDDEEIYYFEPKTVQVLAAETSSVLVGMLKQTLETGTGKSARAWGFNGIAAGKTGTTSDSKDAWFAGFTPKTLTLVWVGYDDNTEHGLTGASGALPIWSLFSRKLKENTPEAGDFKWPESVTKVKLSSDELLTFFSNPEKADQQDIDLIYRQEDLSLIRKLSELESD